jgi:hypothetical protein
VTFLDPGIIAGACGLLGASIWGRRALRKHCAAAAQSHAELRSELQSMLCEQKADWTEQIAQLGRTVAVMELSAQNIDEAGKGGLTRSVRAQAMQLLRSGMSPERAASTMGIGKREMRLIAAVSRTLCLK